MIAPFLLIISLGLLIYGALVTGGIYVPIRSKILIEDEGRAAWCKVELYEDPLGTGSGRVRHVLRKDLPSHLMPGDLFRADSVYHLYHI